MGLEISKNVGRSLPPAHSPEIERALQISYEVATYLWEKGMQLIEVATPAVKSFLDRKEVKNITQDPTFNSVIEKVKTCVSSISDKPTLLCGLTWISRKIPIIRRVSFVFNITLFCSLVHMGQRLQKIDTKGAEENKIFHASNEQAKELTSQDKQLIGAIAEQITSDLTTKKTLLHDLIADLRIRKERTKLRVMREKIVERISSSKTSFSQAHSQCKIPSQPAYHTSKQITAC